MNRLHGTILTPQGWKLGEIAFGTDIEVLDAQAADPEGDDGAYIIPGFIDLHVHGGGGADVMEAGSALRTICRTHAAHGTTSLLATTMTAPDDEIRAALASVRDVMESPNAGATVLGVHLEGPHISPDRLGAQPDAVRPAVLEELLALHALAPLRVVTLAPEVHGNAGLISALCEAGIRVQIGHSNGSYEDGVAALERGASSFTHLFNAMSALHHRAPGMVGAALAHARHAELIPDLQHVHPGAIRTALRCIPNLYCVTDATAAAGMPDGTYKLGAQTVNKCLGGVRLADGTLAGSALTMDAALRNLVAIGLALDDAVRRLSTFPAAYLGEQRRGALEPGRIADIVVLDRALRVRQVFISGQPFLDHEAQ